MISTSPNYFDPLSKAEEEQVETAPRPGARREARGKIVKFAIDAPTPPAPPRKNPKPYTITLSPNPKTLNLKP